MRKCPRCGSPNTRKRYKFHLFNSRRCRRCNNTFGSTGGILALLAIAALAAAGGWYALTQGLLAPPQLAQLTIAPSPTPAAPMPTPTNTPNAQATIDASVRATTVAAGVSPPPTSTPLPTATPSATPLPTSTPRPAIERVADAAATTVAKAASTTVVSASTTVAKAVPLTPTATASPTPTPTLVPTILVLDADTTVAGYWSDGTANVDVALALRNDGRLPYEQTQRITISCAREGNPIEDCGATTDIALPDGFGGGEANLTLRLPMGETTLEIDYGGAAALSAVAVVPQRILGIEREVWDCYSDRDTSRNYEGDHGCYGWYSDVVEKWRSGSVVKIWGEGHPNYIRATKEIFDEQLAPLLNLEFQLVDNEADANFVAAFLSTDEVGGKFGKSWEECDHCWGHGGPTSFVLDDRGDWSEVEGGAFTIFDKDMLDSSEDSILEDYEKLKPYLTGVILHEGLHALAPTGHAEASATNSIMDGAVYLTYMDKAILALNYHPLVEPGMTMSEVRDLIVLKDELLDDPPEDFDLHKFLERTYAALRREGAIRMKIRGGWTGGECSRAFGHPEWAELAISHFISRHDDPRMAYLRDGGKSFFIFHSEEADADTGDGWQHWAKISSN